MSIERSVEYESRVSDMLSSNFEAALSGQRTWQVRLEMRAPMATIRAT